MDKYVNCVLGNSVFVVVFKLSFKLVLAPIIIDYKKQTINYTIILLIFVYIG